MPDDDVIRTLRDALRVSPRNAPLLRHLADLLAGRGDWEAAEQEYKKALALAPDDLDAKLGLAEAFRLQHKLSAALAILEGLLKSPDLPAKAHALAARLFLEEGDGDKARRHYRAACDRDPSFRDESLENRLTENAQPHPREKVALGAGTEAAPPSTSLEKPRVDFSHVGGMEKLKDEIRLKIVHPLTHADVYKAYGKTAGGGMLLYGPPGCGKTHLARATAGEVKAYFLAVGIHDVLNMYLGQSERNLHEIFELARSNTPCVLFFDEVDALGANRSDMRQSAGRQLINQFLAEMDGINASNEGILILAATNAPWHLDSAFRRPGRFERLLFVPPPDLPAREAILGIHLQGKPLKDVDAAKVAKKAEGFSGADLKALVDKAVEGKLAQALKTGIPLPLETEDLLQAAKQLKPTTQEWFLNARNYALYANQGGMYDEILAYLK